MTSYSPTPQQTAFVDALVGTDRNIALVARAGTGKTTTILQGVDAYHRAHPTHEIVVCAFNKAIADEVKEKLQAKNYDWRKVQAGTIHSLGFGLLKFAFKPEVAQSKVRDIVDAQNEEIYRVYRSQIIDLVRYAKGAGFGFFQDSQIGDLCAWYRLADHYDVNGLDDTSEMDAVVEAAQKVYRISLMDVGRVDFDDMILLPLIKNLRVKYPKDLIVLDEAQDLSRARQALARKFLRPGTGRMIVVGDDRQAIYGFSGADAQALQNLQEELDALTLPLTVTWRCPPAVIREAQKLVPDIVSAKTDEGSVQHLPELPEGLRADDAILCRNTAPLIDIAYALIRKKIPCRVEGRAIGEGLLRLVDRWSVKTVDRFLEKLDDYKAREIQKALARKHESKIPEIEDRVATLVAICEACAAQGKRTLGDVRRAIEEMFGDDVRGVLTLATYHRSKGREWDRVILWQHDQRCPSRAARQAWQQLQEKNLAYVAITRAKQELIYVG